MLSVFHPLHRNVLKEIPSCPETMKYSKWRIYRHRSVPFSPWRQRRKRWNPRQKGTCEISQVVTCGSASFAVIYREAIEGFRVLECREPLWELPLSSRRTPQVRFRSVTRVASVEAALNRFQAFLNVSEPMAGCDLTPGATVSSRVSSIKQGIGDINASFFFFLSFFYSDLGICWEKKKYFVFWKGEF